MRWLKEKRPIPKGFFRNIGIFLAVIGPGIITANVDNDAGGIATYSVAGADFGYNLLWTTIPVCIALVVIMEMSARLGAVSGRGLSDLIREHFGLKITFYLMMILLAVNIGNVMSNFAGVAAGMQLFGINKYMSVPLGAFLVWALVVKGTYKSVEKIFLFACLFYIAYVVSGFIAKPDWNEVLISTVKPVIKLNSMYLYMIIGIVGTSIAPWMQFYQQSAVVEKGITADSYQHARWDVYVGAVAAIVVIYFIILTCGATLFKSGIKIENAADAALALKPIAGAYCFKLFAFGLVNASLFAGSIIPLSTAFTVCEGLGWENGVNKTFKEAPHFYRLYTAIIVISAAAVLYPNFPLLGTMIFSQVLNGILLPFILIFMLILINKKSLMGDFKNGPIFNTIAWATALLLIALTIALVVTLL
ncbi:MAG: Mn transporter [Deltaproteobacteria bacterium CG11_big_fil_rev_8_21_14_0_20_49_13]|nr:MAG: Mn transporter [Deltaproteobacteria bacterium CG11_big_fil_rev_8_21_14_0_20_49_13]